MSKVAITTVHRDVAGQRFTKISAPYDPELQTFPTYVTAWSDPKHDLWRLNFMFKYKDIVEVAVHLSTFISDMTDVFRNNHKLTDEEAATMASEYILTLKDEWRKPHE